MPLEYTLQDHRYRFAAWAAGRAASTNGCRFSVELGKSLLATAQLDGLRHPDDLPSFAEFDEYHTRWRTTIVEHAHANGLNSFTHGVAAKLINVFLKAIFVCGGHESHETVAALHPPIDNLLLTELAISEDDPGLKRAWALARATRWSKFDDSAYRAVITTIKQKVNFPTNPMWSIEQYWRGHQ